MGSVIEKNDMNYDIVIPYRETSTLELQYTVRGIMKNFPHNNIHIIGDGTTGTDHIKHPWARRYSSLLNVESKTIQACEQLVKTDYYWLFNDDFFVLSEVKDVPVYHRGTLRESISERHFRDSYTIAMTNTMNYLRGQGIVEPLNYELHMPMLFNTKKRLEYLQELIPIWRRRDLLIRSIYANLEELGGTQIDDVKNPLDYYGRPFLSTSNNSFEQEPIGEYIREKLL